MARLFLAAVLLCSCVAGLTAGGARADGATINVIYTTSTIQIKTDSGTVISAGTVIPAGSYTIQVYDSGDFPNPDFTMSGPGVNVSSNLNSTGMGIDVPSTVGPVNLAINSSYTIGDSNMSARITFGTSSVMAAGGGTSSGGGGSVSSGGSSGGGTKSGTGTGPSATKSASLPALAGALTAGGKATLMSSGATAKSLKAGSYELTVIDKSKKAGYDVGKGSTRIVISGPAAVGTVSKTVKLTPGKWWIGASNGAPRVYFTVK
jgi:hypothetical protein